LDRSRDASYVTLHKSQNVLKTDPFKEQRCAEEL
jgi:hypothetical protein